MKAPVSGAFPLPCWPSPIRDRCEWQRHGNSGRSNRRPPSRLLYAQIVTCEHLFVTSQDPPYGRLRRALDTGNPTIAFAAAAELDFVSLPDALEIVLILVDEPGKFRRAALRWHARYCGEIRDVGFEEAHAVLACLAGLAGRRPKAAASALAELVHRRGLERASEVLLRWAPPQQPSRRWSSNATGTRRT
jgi:hypothetical protein